MKLHRLAGLVAGFACLVPAAPAAADPANVIVRIEGATSTLREEGTVRTTTDPVSKDGTNSCTGTSAAGALEQATGGDWGGSYFDGFGYSVERIFSEIYAFDDPEGDFWGLYVNNRESSTGVCGIELQEGDEVLFFVARCTNPEPPDFACKNEAVRPLELRAPTAASTDAPSEVSVVRYDSVGTASPVSGARVTGPGVDATTGDDGKASVRFGQSGDIRLKADKAGAARSAAEVVRVAAPGQPVVEPPTTTTPDTAAPEAEIAGIRSGRKYSRKRAPRTLRGTVEPDPSGIKAVKLSLTRRVGKRCFEYSLKQERFRRERCGERAYFSIGDRQDWSYLLPERLRKGRYTLDVVAVDKQGNRDEIVPGRNRVVFTVR